MTNSSYRIGLDGGGTKTELILVTAAGVVVARHSAPGCNPSQIGPEKAAAVVREAFAELAAKSKIENLHSKISATHLYTAGSSIFWKEFAATLRALGAAPLARAG